MELDDDLYRIGTVAGLTGVSVERLRAWDRRYGLAPAHRAGKTRFYNRAQLERLKRIKQLIDEGQADRKNNRLKCESWDVDLMGDGSWRCGRGS
jgi:hypothetical protein